MSIEYLINITVNTIINEFSDYHCVQVTETRTCDKLIQLRNNHDTLYVSLSLNDNSDDTFVYMDISIEELNDYIQGTVKINRLKSHILIRFYDKYRNISKCYRLN